VHVLAVVVGTALVLTIMWEAFETLVLPRRVSRRFRLTRGYYRVLWGLWSSIGSKHPGPRRENYLSVFGPLSLLLLLGFWISGAIVGFALIKWGLHVPFAPEGQIGFPAQLYVSTTTFVTLGLGDLAPTSPIGRVLTGIEAIAGFGFLALAISYLPVLYQAFSRREVRISQLDQWAGSPPSAVELLRRSATKGSLESVDRLLGDWERWASELLESHLSYPVLAYFRSQHEQESWLAALTAILDTCALVLAGIETVSGWQAWRTFAISRHAVVDLAEVLRIEPLLPPADRLDDGMMDRLRELLAAADVKLDDAAMERLVPLRKKYEPYVYGLSLRVRMPLPSFMPSPGAVDDWERSAWTLPG
jgi:Ion channel